MYKFSDWQHAVEFNLENVNLPSNRTMYYRMPRRSGVTTFLVDLANDYASQGKKVLFIVDKLNTGDLLGLNKNVDFTSMRSMRNGTKRGFRYDLAIGDGVGDHRKEIEESFSYMVGGHTLLIDTVE